MVKKRKAKAQKMEPTLENLTRTRSPNEFRHMALKILQDNPARTRRVKIILSKTGFERDKCYDNLMMRLDGILKAFTDNKNMALDEQKQVVYANLNGVKKKKVAQCA